MEIQHSQNKLRKTHAATSTPATFSRRLGELGDENKRLHTALETIAGGYIDRFPGAPDVMAESPDIFRHKMWIWSQEVARAALASSSQI